MSTPDNFGDGGQGLSRGNPLPDGRYLAGILQGIEDSVSGLAADVSGLTCLSGDAVGDWMYVSAASTVAKADADNTAKIPVLGPIVSKQSSTSCTVRVSGLVTGLAGLTAGATYYLSATAGAITTSAPSNHALPVAIAISTTSLVVLPSIFGAGAATIRGNANIAGTLAVTGAVALTAALTVGTTLDVTGAIMGSSTLRATAIGAGQAAPAAGVATAGPVKPGTYTVGTVPAAASYTGAIIWVSDASGGAKPAISDGTNWKVISLGSTLS